MTGLHAYIDVSAGVAGDMLLGALVDAGAELAILQARVDAVLPGAVRLRRTAVTRAGLRATKVDVDVLFDNPPHRTWRTIADLIAAADLPEPVRDQALRVFGRLADAEGHVHGIPAADVHFHEVGALDSIADVVGVCAALDLVGIVTLSASEVALGSGRVTMAHGEIPIPAPAVAELARGWRVRGGGRGELTTPTGMALIATLCERSEDLPSMTIATVGVGAGSRDTAGRPNVTRVVVGSIAGRVADDGDESLVLEANVDDLDPRLWPGILTRLLQAGAADAWLVPIVMKKGRPAHTLCVLCDPLRVDVLRALIFDWSSTFGIRQHAVRKHALPRAWVDVPVAGGSVAVKIAHRAGVIVQVSPEFDQVAALARALGRPQKDLLDAAQAAATGAGLAVGAAVPDAARTAGEGPP
jgi:uncharacterized protein (TIGR00299 family) protein